MALKKDIIFNNGVKIKYHRINNITFTNGITNVDISSYTDESYRLKEKENKKNQERYEELLKMIFNENEKSVEERNVDKVIQWSDESNKLVTLIKENEDLKVIMINKSFENVTDFNMSNLYSLLKEDELFKDSEDLI